MRKVLAEVSRTGLPGNHHFFITFLTGAHSARVFRLRERYPEQMTIVIQFQYEDESDRYRLRGRTVFLRRAGKLEPSLVRGFFDPSVNFELEFDVKTDAPVEEGHPQLPNRSPLSPRKSRRRRKRPRSRKEGGRCGSGKDVMSCRSTHSARSDLAGAKWPISSNWSARAEERVAGQNRALYGRSKTNRESDRVMAVKAEKFVAGHPPRNATIRTDKAT